MKQTSPLESPKSLFTQPQGFKGLQVPKCSPNVIRNLGVNFEDLMAVPSDPTSPNFQKVNEFLKSPSFQGSKPVSMIFPEVSQNSWMIPLQENCLETSMPFEDLIGQLESPKLSDKMQMIFNSNVNLSESIMKNTFRAVDESRVKLEDKDLQVELEISELKLHHLEKKVEGCLASSKTTLAMNAQLSQNVSRMVSPAKSSHTVLTANIRTRSNSRVNTPRGNAEDSLSPFNSQHLSNKREALSMGKNRPKSVNQRIEDTQLEQSMKPFPSAQDEREPDFTGEDNMFVRDSREMQREKISGAEKRVKSVSMSIQDPNSRLKDSIINEAYQKLNCYIGPGDTRKSQSDNQGEKRDGEIETVQTRDSHSPSKSTELIMSNNITFYTNMLEKEGNMDPEEQNKNMTRLQSNDCLSEDQDQGHKHTFVFGSKPREPVTTHVAPLEPRLNTMPREVPLIGADGKERIFVLKPKETLRVERLESIFIIPIGNKGSVLKPSKVRSHFSSFQCSETEECSQIKENLRHAQYDHTPSGNQTVVGSQSRVSFFDNSNIASMNLDRGEPKLSGFNAQTHQEPLGEANSSQNQKEAYLNNLKLQILNHPKCQKFFAREDTLSTRGRFYDFASKENDGMEFYFKQKINDFREFLNEFERILPTETSVSPGREPATKQKKIKQVKSCEFQGVQEAIKREPSFENGNFESRTVENTPRGFENESHEQMKDKYNGSMKKSVSVIGCVAEKSPQTNDQKKKIKFVNLEDNEAETHYISKANQESPFSVSKMSFSSPKSGFNSPVQSLKKKSKVIKSLNQKESLQIPSMSIKLNKGNHSITIPPNQGVEKKRAHDKNNSMKIITQQAKTKKTNEGEMDKSAETKKKGKTITRGNSKSIVEAVTLNRIQNRANSVVVVEK